MIWLIRATLASRLLKFAAIILLGLAIAVTGCTALATQTLQFAAVGIANPAAAITPTQVPAPGNPIVPNPPAPVIVPPAVAGFFSDVQRFQLALSVGFTPAEAEIATPISLAENGPGNPLAVGHNAPPYPPDYGLWQINGVHCGDVGGCQNLFDPVTNAREALKLYRSGGWTQWCTFPGGCGGGPGAKNWPQVLAQAQAVARQLGY